MFREKIVPVAWLFLASVIIGLSVGFFMRPDVHAGGAELVVPAPATVEPLRSVMSVPPKPDCWSIGGPVQ